MGMGPGGGFRVGDCRSAMVGCRFHDQVNRIQNEIKSRGSIIPDYDGGCLALEFGLAHWSLPWAEPPSADDGHDDGGLRSSSSLGGLSRLKLPVSGS